MKDKEALHCKLLILSITCELQSSNATTNWIYICHLLQVPPVWIKSNSGTTCKHEVLNW